MGRRLVSIAVLTVLLSSVGAVMAASGALADEKTATFTIQLSGAAEVCPTAPGTCGGPGTGTATITIDRNVRTLCYTIMTSNVALPLLAAHIHVAPVGEAGPVVILLFTQPVNATTVAACLSDLDKNLLKAIIRNPQNYYVNVHNTPSPTARSAASSPDHSPPSTPGRQVSPGAWRLADISKIGDRRAGYRERASTALCAGCLLVSVGGAGSTFGSDSV